MKNFEGSFFEVTEVTDQDLTVSGITVAQAYQRFRR